LNPEELIKTIEEHRVWLEFGGRVGQQANLHKADLRDADLGGVDLYGVDLSEANLARANIRGYFGRS
jgi:uncharacterized protein YjbI with pentapeptide repeats